MVDLKEGGTLEATVDAATAAFESYVPTMHENVWHALFSVQANMLEQQGGNNFGVPHEGGRNAVRTEKMVEAYYVNFPLVTHGRQILETHKINRTIIFGLKKGRDVPSNNG